MTNLERRLIDDDDGAAPASHYSTNAPHRDPRRCHDGGTARPRSPRARPTSSLRERPGRVRSCSPSPARPHVGRAGPRAPRPSGSERSSSRPSCSSCTVTPTSSSYYPACRFLSPPSAHKEFAVESDHVGLPTKEFQFAVLENDTILPHTPQGPGEMFRGRGMVPARPGPSSCTSRRAAPSRRTGRRSTTGGGPRGSRSPRRPCRAARGWSSRGRRRPRRRC